MNNIFKKLCLAIKAQTKEIKENKKDPGKIEIDFDTHTFKEIFMKEDETYAYFHENIYITDEIFLRVIAITDAGIFLIIPVEDVNDAMSLDIAIVTQFLGITRKQAVVVYCFEKEVCIKENRGHTFAELWDEKNYLLLDHPYKQIRDYFENSLRPETYKRYLEINNERDLFTDTYIYDEKIRLHQNNSKNEKSHFIKDGIVYELKQEYEPLDSGQVKSVKYRLDEETIERIEEKIRDYENNKRPVSIDKNIYIDSNGKQWVQKYEDLLEEKIHIPTGFIGKEKWFPVSEIDPDSFFIRTALGGFLGYHKFSTGNILSGIIYMMTCGFAGIFTFLDMLQLSSGNFYYYVNEYEDSDGKLKQISHKEYIGKSSYSPFIRIAVCFISLLAGYFIFKYLYLNVYKAVTDILINSGILTEGSGAENLIKIFGI